MERFSTLVLMLAGVAIGGYELMPAPPEDTTTFVLATHVSAVPKTTTSDDRALRDNVRAEEPVRTFSPTSPAFREHNRLEQANAAVLAAGSNTGAWTTVVTAEQPRTTALKPPKPNDWQTRYELARDLQRELKRVGCYGGEISGVWTRGSKAAMSNFMDRVNASLPVDQPDYVLLSLVQGHRQIACGVECPSGQVIAEGGRCVPRAVVAQATKKSQRLQERRLAEARLAAERQAIASPHRTAAERGRSKSGVAVRRARETALARSQQAVDQTPHSRPSGEHSWPDGHRRSCSLRSPRSSRPRTATPSSDIGRDRRKRRPIATSTGPHVASTVMMALGGPTTDANADGAPQIFLEDVWSDWPKAAAKQRILQPANAASGHTARSGHHSRTTSEFEIFLWSVLKSSADALRAFTATEPNELTFSV